MQRETILEIGAEGGSLTVFRQRTTKGDWSFTVVRNEETLRGMLSEEDAKGLNFSDSETAHSFEELKGLFRHAGQNIKL